ncbi:MAG TPA: tyrosine-type recombinase/integrase [Crinalium sp.]|jgi:site-specific recombinase XerD
MKVQRIRLPNQTESWLVLDDNHLPIPPIQSYLHYLEGLEYSPNTIHNYATHLKQFWEFLREFQHQWDAITVEHLADFIRWLRHPASKVISIQGQAPQRTERTINTILAAVYSFYDYHERMGTVAGLQAYGYTTRYSSKYKSLLHHIQVGKEQKIKLLKLKEPRQIPTVLTSAQMQQIVEACHHLRDQLLICLLYETGMRIGQVLGLRHVDVRSWDNEIQVVPRTDNANGARAKSKESYIVHVSQPLMRLYAEYLINEYPEDIDSDYVFINLWSGQIGQPLSYQTVVALLRQISQVTGITLHAHLFRHTHATELLRQGWELSYIQKRLGHANIQTTANTYVHLQADDLKSAYQQYLAQKET